MNRNIGNDILRDFSSDNVFENLLYCQHLKLKNDAGKLSKTVNDLIADKDVSKLTVFECGALLNMIAELYYAGKKPERQDSAQYIDSLIDRALSFETVEKNIMYGVSQVNTSTVSSVYSGLKNINNFLKSEKISQNLRRIRDYVFKNNLDGNVLTNGNAVKDVTFDILLCCVPFGMFEPEDLVLVEAVKKLKQRNPDENSTTENLLMALYLVEQGSCNLAKIYMKNAADMGIETAPDAAMYQVLYHQLEQKKMLDDLMIKHIPGGNGNVYSPTQYERIPETVREGETVIIRAETWPAGEEVNPLLKYAHEGIQYHKSGRYVKSGAGYYEWEIGPFNGGDRIEYAFFIRHGDKTVETDKYGFDVLKKFALASVNKVSGGEKSLKLEFSRNIYLSVSISDSGDFELAVNGKVKGGCRISAGKLENGALEMKSRSNTLYFDNGRLHDEKKTIDISGIAAYLDALGGPQIITAIINNRDGESFYGFGERYNALDQRGNAPDVYVYNQYKDQGLKTYMPVSFYMSSAGYGCYVNTSTYKKFDLGCSDPGKTVITEYGEQTRMHFMYGSPVELVRKHTDISGKPVIMSKWAFGPWMSSNNWDCRDEVLFQLEQTKKHRIPSTVLVIEQWSDEATFYIFNDSVYDEKNSSGKYEIKDYRFPDWGRWSDPKGMIDKLHEENIKCILWQIPILKKMFGIRHLQSELDISHAIEKGYVVRNPDGSPYRIPEGWFMGALLIDFTNNNAVKWWFDKRKYLTDELGVDGFKTDGGEFVFGRDLRFADGRTGSEMRNEYPNLYIGEYYKFINRNNPLRGITFSRAGYNGAQNFPAHWAGDERSTFEAFQRSLFAGLSAGLSGISYWGWDLGGFSGEIPTAELFIRAAQFAAFCPVMQYHAESKAEFNQDRTPWNIQERTGDKRVIPAYRDYANLRMNLLPYIFNEALHSSQTGEPLMRAMLLDYPDDNDARNSSTQYMFGRSLLVAPVIEQGAVSRKLYLPEGEWTGLFDKKVVSGGRHIEVNAGIVQIPVYVKDNSVIPLNLGDKHELMEDVGNDTDSYKNLTFLLTGDNVESGFSDDLGNCFSFRMRRVNGLLRLNIKTNFKGNYHILHNEDVIMINNSLSRGCSSGKFNIFKV